MDIRFERSTQMARFRSPDGNTPVTRACEVRRDPLLGYSSRIAEGVVLKAREANAEPPTGPGFDSANCPFCPQRAERVTPQIPPEISPEPRLRRGDTLLFPNLVSYSQYAAVAAFTASHWFQLADFTPERLRDNLAATQEYVRRVYCHDPAAPWCAWNINYLYPSGGSLPHPHAQVYLDPQPTTVMRLQAEAARHYYERQGSAYWDDLAAEEERLGERWLGCLGRTRWFTPFAPLGFNHVNATVGGRSALLDLDDEDLADLSGGIARVLHGYAALGYDSFNLALYSGPLSGDPAARVHLAMITRSAMLPYYRSDAMYLERLHWEAALDRTPESVARDLRAAFRPRV